jgi:hypothetical protein
VAIKIVAMASREDFDDFRLTDIQFSGTKSAASTIFRHTVGMKPDRRQFISLAAGFASMTLVPTGAKG